MTENKSTNPKENSIFKPTNNHFLDHNGCKVADIWIELKDQRDLKFICQELKGKDNIYDHKAISQFIGMKKQAFRNVLYVNKRIKQENFAKFINLVRTQLGADYLIKLFGVDDIPHKKIIGRAGHIRIHLPRNKITSEFVGIMLGDGQMGRDLKKVRICLNDIDEKEYFTYVRKRILKTLFKGITFTISKKKGDKGSVLRCKIKAVHLSLLELGLIEGNKVVNQVEVPQWIKDDKAMDLNITNGCVKGLFDTDGSISVKEIDNRFYLTFDNESKRLVKDFHKMLTKLHIKSVLSPSSTRCGIYAYREIRKFLRVIKPEKFKESSKRLWLGLKLLYSHAPTDIQTQVKRKITRWLKRHGKKRYIYGFYRTLLLKHWLEASMRKYCILKVNGLPFHREITFNMIKSSITTAMDYDRVKYQHIKTTNSYKIIRFPEKLRRLICVVIANYIKGSRLPANNEIIQHIRNFIE